MGVWNFLSASLRKQTFFQDGNPAFDLCLVGRFYELTGRYYHMVTFWGYYMKVMSPSYYPIVSILNI